MGIYFRFNTPDTIARYKLAMADMARDATFYAMWLSATHQGADREKAEEARLMMADKAEELGNEWLAVFLRECCTTDIDESFSKEN